MSRFAPFYFVPNALVLRYICAMRVFQGQQVVEDFPNASQQDFERAALLYRATDGDRTFHAEYDGQAFPLGEHELSMLFDDMLNRHPL